MKRAVNHPYEKFSKALKLTSTEHGPNARWSGVTFTNTDQVFELWNSMSKRSKSRLVSDSRWNHYPQMSYTERSAKKFGYIIGEIIKRSLSRYSEDDLRPIINNSSGVWAIYMLDNAHSSVRLKMAKRLRKSPDTRVRTRCAKILPVSFLHAMLSDKHYRVRGSALQRIGIDNCYKSFLPSSLTVDKVDNQWWWKSWLSRQAVTLAEREEFEHLINQARELDPEATDFGSIDMILAALIERMSPEEALYFINLKDANGRISRALEQKLKYT